MKLVLTRTAERDITRILEESARTFGIGQMEIYAAILDRGMAIVLENPERSSRKRPDLGEGVRAFHLSLASGRRGGASHVLYYIRDETALTVLRVLHDRMEPRRRLAFLIGEGPDDPD